MIALTIVIGLGGIGSEICCRVSKQVLDESQRKRIRFVCIDTDINDLANRREEDPRLVTIQISAPYTVGNYLRTNTNTRDNWFPNHNVLMGKTPTEGAGQVRAISRLAFEEALREGRMAELDKAIEELYFLDGAAAPQAVRVIIVSTLAGGTGSGIVLPVALYVRHFLETRFRKSASVVRGFFLLPEIMFGGKCPEERNSLCCNAYAAMRELDAFMRRGDGALTGSKYKDMKLELPDSSSGNYVDYQVSPFNFCFLYDKRNTDDLQLKSFDDYKEHAANTIYAQAISGMSGRSNSNEDNTIKPLIKSNGRNRFCGAGSSLLKYPRDSVLRYMAGKWCIQVMDTEWLSIDNAYQRYLADQKVQRKKNPSLRDVPLEDFYIDRAEQSEEGSFERQLYDMCRVLTEDDTGNLQYTSKVDKYTNALTEYITGQLAKAPELIEADDDYSRAYQRLDDAFAHRKTDDENKIRASEFQDESHALDGCVQGYINTALKSGSRLGRTLAMQLFQNERIGIEGGQPYRMESYMRDEEQKFIHPNAARYFIYRLRKSFAEGIDGAKEQMEDLMEDIESFDDPNTPKKETAGEYIEENIDKSPSIISTDRKARKEMMEKFQTQHDAAFEYAVLLAQKAVYEAGVTYLQAMSDAFEKFYSNFAGYLKGTHFEVAEIERKYVNGEGKATRYVCASETCLKGMLEDMPCTGESSSVNGDLSAAIYQEMRSYAMMVRKPNASLYFSSLYNDTIMGFWEGQVENLYAAQINMDILTALEVEADYESKENLTDDQKRHYAAQILQQAERLAAPFIEEPMGEIRHPFTICTYNPSVMGAPDSTRRSFVSANLNDQMGGQTDENVSPYELMIYKAIYNMSAGDLQRFRAPEGKNQQGGEYYAAYINTIRQLGPDTSSNPVLTPHLDKHWHLTKYMPDLDDRNQEILENEVYSALTWGMLTGKIEQKDDDTETGHTRLIYRPRTRNSELFVVSNGTPCDELCEVVDALAINPPQVSLILEDMQETLELERKDRIALSDGLLMQCLSWTDERAVFGEDYDEPEEGENALRRSGNTKFRIRQFAPLQNATIFDLIYWIKASTPADEFAEEEVSIILSTMLKLLEDYVEMYTGKLNVHNRCYALLVDQFKQFMTNLADPSIRRPRNRLSDPCVSIIRDELDKRIKTVYQVPAKKRGIMEVLYQNAMNSWDAT